MSERGNVFKAVSIIDSLKFEKDGLSLKEISNITCISKTTVYRLCGMLVDCGVLHKNEETKVYKLGPKFLEWLFVFKDNLSVFREIKDILRSISRAVGETVTVFKRCGFERECVFRFEVSEMLRYSIEIGERLPLHRGAGGKVILAFFGEDELNEYLKRVDLGDTSGVDLIAELKSVKEDGYCFSYGEREPYVAAFSVPLFRGDSGIMGSLSVSGPLERFKNRFREEHIALVKSKAFLVQELFSLVQGGQ